MRYKNKNNFQDHLIEFNLHIWYQNEIQKYYSDRLEFEGKNS